jgi:hypothetical protein
MDRSNSNKKYRSKRSRNSTSSNNENNNFKNSRRSKKSKKNPKSKSKSTVRSSSAPPKLPNQVNYLNNEILKLTNGMGKL